MKRLSILLVTILVLVGCAPQDKQKEVVDKEIQLVNVEEEVTVEEQQKLISAEEMAVLVKDFLENYGLNEEFVNNIKVEAHPGYRGNHESVAIYLINNNDYIFNPTKMEFTVSKEEVRPMLVYLTNYCYTVLKDIQEAFPNYQYNLSVNISDETDSELTHAYVGEYEKEIRILNKTTFMYQCQFGEIIDEVNISELEYLK